MCSSPEKPEKQTKAKCCPGPNLKVSKLIRKVCVRKHKTKEGQAMVMPIMANNENLPPDVNARTKKYTVNKKRSEKQHYDRLRQYVPTLEGKEDVSQLDVLLEAIQYIQALKKDLTKAPEQEKPVNPPPTAEVAANDHPVKPKTTAV